MKTASGGEISRLLLALKGAELKNNELADSFRRLQSNFYLLLQLIFYDSNGDWRYINESPPKLLAVTTSDIQRVAKDYLAEENRSVAWYERKQGTAPELAALPAQMKPMIKQQLAQIQQETDAQKLQQALSQMQQMEGQVPPQAKPAIQYLIKKVQQRIAELSASEGGN